MGAAFSPGVAERVLFVAMEPRLPPELRGDRLRVTRRSLGYPQRLRRVMELSSPFHNRAQDTVDPGRVALAILQEPVVNFPVDASGHQHLSSPCLNPSIFDLWENRAAAFGCGKN